MLGYNRHPVNIDVPDFSEEPIQPPDARIGELDILCFLWARNGLFFLKVTLVFDSTLTDD